ncbi:MAG TPA: hypothetical protein VLF60_03920 [Candidatus Saccharimonadales bacterium]|nr:hypothetical protein [Candidatus Saccharimonadales bacterium]
MSERPTIKETAKRALLSGAAVIAVSQTVTHEPQPQPPVQSREIVITDPLVSVREKIAAGLFKGEIAKVHDTGKTFLDKNAPPLVPDHHGKLGPPLRNEVNVVLHIERNPAADALAKSYEQPNGPVVVQESGPIAYILGGGGDLSLIVPTKDPHKDAYSPDSLSFTVTPYASWAVGTRIAFAADVEANMFNGLPTQNITASEALPGGLVKTEKGWVYEPDIRVKTTRRLNEDGLSIQKPMPPLSPEHAAE